MSTAQRFAIALSALLLSLQTFPQSLQQYPLADDLNNQIELSSLDLRGDTLLMISEGCATLYEFVLSDLDPGRTNSYSSTTKFKTRCGADLEALATWGAYLLYTDEKDNRIFALHRRTGERIQVQVQSGSLPAQSGKKGSYGLEGLEIDETNNRLYVIQEKDPSETFAPLQTYQIRQENGQLILTFEKEISLPLSDGYRYCALALDPANSQLYLLRTQYENYWIDGFELFTDGSLDLESLETYNLSDLVNPLEDQGYSTNVEGLSLNRNGFFIVSDNYFGSRNKCSKSSDAKTALLHIQF